MKHEIDPMHHTFPRFPVASGPHAPRHFHVGTFEDGSNVFNILILNKEETKFVRASGYIPVSDITDAQAQLQMTELAPAGTKNEELVGFLQDTPAPRKRLEKGKFKEEKPSYRVVPDPIARLML